jgi:Tfp pilus assembly protein PilF
MRRTLLAAVMVLLAVDISYGQTCQAFINGARARMSKDKWEDARQVLAEQLPNCQDDAEFNYLYAVALAKVSPDSGAKAAVHLQAADTLLGEPSGDDDVKLKSDIEQAIAALWGPMVNEGVRALQAGQVDEAQASLELAVRTNPQGKEGHLALGAVHQTKEDYDAAIEHYKRALEIDPAFRDASLRLGSAYQLKADAYASSGDSTKVAEASTIAQQAAEIYNEYLEKNPGDTAVQVQLAGLYASLGQLDKAEPIIRQTMDADSIDPDVLTDFGFRLTNAQQYDLAEQLLERAVVLTDSTDAEPLSYLVFVRIQKGDLAEAKNVIQKQLQLEPSNAEAWEYLAYVERDLGNTAGAQEAFEKAESIPLHLESIRMSQQSDQTWNVDATFSNRTDQPVQGVRVRFSLLSPAGEVLETQEATIGAQSLPAGEAENVSIEFDNPAPSARIKYEIVA